MAKKNNSIVLFHEKQVRHHWDEDKELWYFSIVDVIEILTESINPRKYWSVLKTRLKKEGSEVATNCSRLKLLASDGRITMQRKGGDGGRPTANMLQFKINPCEIFIPKNQRVRTLTNLS